MHFGHSYSSEVEFLSEEQIPDIEDIEDAKEEIAKSLERGEFPIVTVPSQYLDALCKGLQPHSSWIEEEQIIAGTINRLPYMPKNEPRVAVRVKTPLENIEPRLTGHDRHWHGVIVFRGPISPDEIEVLNSYP